LSASGHADRIPLIDAVVGNAAQHGMADIRAATVLDMVADRIAAARIADQRDTRATGPSFQLLDRVNQFATLISVEELLGCANLSSARAIDR